MYRKADRRSSISFLVIGLAGLSLFAAFAAKPEQGLGTSKLGRLYSELDAAEAIEAELYPQYLQVRRLFRDPVEAFKIHGPTARDYHTLLRETRLRGMRPMATISTWVFPKALNAPRIPNPHDDPSVHPNEVLEYCVPDLTGAQYASLSAQRNRIFRSLAGEFSEVDIWVLGNEVPAEFRNCQGKLLDSREHVEFVVDSVVGMASAIRTEIPDATVIVNLLGAPDAPVQTADRSLQPRDLIDHVLAEIEDRGGKASDLFQLFASELSEELAMDRPAAPVLVGSLGGGVAMASAGWNTKWIEEFDTDADDLLVTYDDVFEEFDTPDFLSVVEVDNGVAILLLEDPPTGKKTLAGARTVSGTDVVPDTEFSSSSVERNRWTSVTDFYPKVVPDPDGAHIVTFLRVNPVSGLTDQTRFGTYVRGVANSNNEQASKEFMGLEIDVTPVKMGRKCIFFKLDQQGSASLEDPFDHSTHLYRVQIQEYENFMIATGWRMQWTSQVHDLTDDENIGWTGATMHTTVENVYGLEIPDLDGSRLMFGFGPGDSEGGKVEVERTATAYWVY